MRNKLFLGILNPIYKNSNMQGISATELSTNFRFLKIYIERTQTDLRIATISIQKILN